MCTLKSRYLLWIKLDKILRQSHQKINTVIWVRLTVLWNIIQDKVSLTVSLTSVICKVLEHIVHSHIMDHLEQHKILVYNQHGFRSKHSTETQLILTTNDITKSLEEGETVHMAILDFAKAFDKVPQERFLYRCLYI